MRSPLAHAPIRALSALLLAALPADLPADVIVDNSDAGFSIVSGSWPASANAGFYGTNSLINQVGTGTDKVRWTPTIPSTGQYDVYAWWVPSSNRATDARFEVSHAGGTALVNVNQTTGASQWNALGTWTFNAGSSHKVELTDLSSLSGAFYVSADAVRFAPSGGPPPCTETLTTLTSITTGGSCSACQNFRLPGAAEPHPDTAYYMISDLPEIMRTPGVLCSTQSILPLAPVGETQIPLSLRTQTNAGFTTIDGDFDVFVFHITSPGDGSTPRRVAVYAKNNGASNVTINPRQILITDGTIGTVHQMESTLGERTLEETWDTPISSVVIAPGQGDVIAYSKRFGDSANTSDRSANVNCFGRVRATVTAASGSPDVELYVVGIAGAAVSQNKTQTEAVLGQAAGEGETVLDLTTAPASCDLRRATGVFQSFVWRSDLVTMDADGLGAGTTFQMALPDIQSTFCPTAQQTEPLLLHPGYCRPDTVGNYMTEYRLRFRLVNSSPTTNRAFDINFGKTGADVGLAWQIATGTTLPSDSTVDALPARTGWAGPNQSGLTRSFLASDGGPITLAPCTAREVAIRFLILGNSSLPFQISVVPAVANVEDWSMLD